MEMNVKDTRNQLSALLDRVEMGGEVVILRRGKMAARLVPPDSKGTYLPSLKEFRASIRMTGEPLGNLVVRGREEERY